MIPTPIELLRRTQQPSKRWRKIQLCLPVRGVRVSERGVGVPGSGLGYLERYLERVRVPGRGVRGVPGLFHSVSKTANVNCLQPFASSLKKPRRQLCLPVILRRTQQPSQRWQKSQFCLPVRGIRVSNI